MDDPVPCDFVFAGARLLKGDEIGYAVCVLVNGVASETERLFKEPKLKTALIGGIYTGADFSERQARGLGAARWTSMYDAADARERKIAWRAEHDSAMTFMRTKKLMADAKKVSEIDEAMEPVRRAYTAARKRGDYTLAKAIETAVLESLHKPVKD